MTEHAKTLLTQCAQELANRMLPRDGVAPTWSDLLFVNDQQIDWQVKSVPSNALLPLEAFAPGFHALLKRNPSWIKFAAGGLWKSHLVVVVSASRTKSTSAPVRTNILYSGLTNAVAGDDDWSVERSFSVVSTVPED